MTDPTPEDIAEFKKYIQRWKSAANDDDPILELYREKPNYLLIPFLYETIKNSNENLRLQRANANLTVAVLAVAFVALVAPIYQIFSDSIADPNYRMIAAGGIVALFVVYMYIILRRVIKE